MDSKSSVLVVDDEPNGFEVIEALLFREGYNLSYSASGLEALKVLDEVKPDVILLDVMMPEFDGIETCIRIKSNQGWCHIPIIMVTALNSKEDLAQCLDAGADDFIGKPITGLELKARVRSMLRIKKQHDSLQATLKLREDMSHMIVHDLRNPLASIVMSCEILQQTQLQEKQLRKAEQIFKSAQRLQSLADDLLMMAKLESGKINIKRDLVNLNELEQEVVSDFLSIAQQKNIELVSHLPESGNTIPLDLNLFRRVFDNLISNAIKFSPSDSQITLQVDYPRDTKTQAIIRIADAGPGIHQHLRKSIFDKYEVGNLMAGVSQIGLGLAFCKMAVEAHGGRIFVEDNQPRGSVFTVEI
ncbi:MAG: response regulator [Symploca sp. SIO3C6]|uniref:histidine kinase n=1 Tax=Symploca sp. SIO1C4 TaxID=2607765 RepID=A0A6B3N7V3_9CYAN|nr:response regulator [Symploca sp. SIO3C6]NER26702.1 response regulator [Symploca sp. SIO1C4]NET08193.1 response regulator [Symploca sp. SIO2B6]